ncbi:MAG: helix-turn-helix transcriptional regulator [Lachnospiraceae bacterium]|nr:helix-turn-helix transcriptional regulator [Lachnospiraceae bacterium]
MKLYRHVNGKCNISGTAIRELREAAGLSQEQLAARLQLAGLSLNQKAVSRIETGDRVVPDFELLYFAQVFNVSIHRLFGKDLDPIITIFPDKL